MLHTTAPGQAGRATMIAHPEGLSNFSARAEARFPRCWGRPEQNFHAAGAGQSKISTLLGLARVRFLRCWGRSPDRVPSFGSVWRPAEAGPAEARFPRCWGRPKQDFHTAGAGLQTESPHSARSGDWEPSRRRRQKQDFHTAGAGLQTESPHSARSGDRPKRDRPKQDRPKRDRPRRDRPKQLDARSGSV